VVPENIHTPPHGRSLEIPRGTGVQRQKFPRGVGGSWEAPFPVACCRRSDSGARAKTKASERAGKNEGRLGARTRERL